MEVDLLPRKDPQRTGEMDLPFAGFLVQPHLADRLDLAPPVRAIRPLAFLPS